MTGRTTAAVDGEFVVFLIGMRVNALWKIHRWLPVLFAMPRMLRELRSRDRSGLLESRTTVSWRGVTVIQYWDSFEELRGYARDPDGDHLDAWQWYNRDVADTGAVGIWHETYLVGEPDYEAIYNRMPAQGLAAAGDTVPAEGSLLSASGRLGDTDGTDAPVAPDGTTTGPGSGGSQSATDPEGARGEATVASDGTES